LEDGAIRRQIPEGVSDMKKILVEVDGDKKILIYIDGLGPQILQNDFSIYESIGILESIKQIVMYKRDRK
jgi:hypothetical protein